MIVNLSNKKVIIGATGTERIKQQVRIVLNTVKGTVPFDRTFGVDLTPLDLPPEAVKQLIISNTADEVEKQVEGISVTKVSFENDNELIEGIIKPILEIKIED